MHGGLEVSRKWISVMECGGCGVRAHTAFGWPATFVYQPMSESGVSPIPRQPPQTMTPVVLRATLYNLSATRFLKPPYRFRLETNLLPAR